MRPYFNSWLIMAVSLLAAAPGDNAARAGEVVLTASNPANVKLPSWPVTIAVPFPVAALPEPEGLAILGPHGEPVPAQFAVLTRWWARDNSVATLLVTFLADPAVPSYRLAYGLAGPPVAKPKRPVTVTRDGDRIVVENGFLRAVVNCEKFGLFEELAYDPGGQAAWAGNQVTGPGAGGGLRQSGFSAGAMKPQHVTIDERGPVRAIITVRGRFAKPGGETQLSYLLRMHFAAALPMVKLDYTFIQDDGTVFEKVEDLSLDIGLPAGGRRVTFGLGDTTKSFDVSIGDEVELMQVGEEMHVEPEIPRTDPISRQATTPPDFHRKLLQERRQWWSPRETARWERDERNKAFMATCSLNGDEQGRVERAPGWVRIEPEGKDWAMSAGVRWFWQLHPKKISVAGDRLRMFMIPPAKYPLDVHTGTAKTHTVYLALHSKDDTPASQAYHDAIDSPLLYFPSAQWMCDSGVWGPLFPVTPGKFRYFEESNDFYLRRRNKPRSYEYGMFNFGDRLQSKLCWNNMETALDYGLFIAFLRTADRDYYDMFERAVLHFRDVDVCHSELTKERFDYGQWLAPGYVPMKLAKACAQDEKLRDSVFYYLGDQPPHKGGVRRHSIDHYANADPSGRDLSPRLPEYKRGKIYAGTCAVGGHGWIIGTIAHYMLTGDRFSRETATDTGNLILNQYRDEPAWGRDNWRNIDLAHLYRMTGDEAYRDLLVEAIDLIHADRQRIVDLVEEGKATPYMLGVLYTIGNYIRAYYDMTGDEQVAKELVDLVDIWIDENDKNKVDTSCGKVFDYIRDFKDSRCHGDFVDLAYAYRFTGDRSYIDRGLVSLKVYARIATGQTAPYEMPCLLVYLDKLGIDPLDSPFPAARNATEAAFEEDQDRAFNVYVSQHVGYRQPAVPIEGHIMVKDPAGNAVAQRRITMGGLDYFELSVPADGIHGTYTVSIDAPAKYHVACDLPPASHD